MLKVSGNRLRKKWNHLKTKWPETAYSLDKWHGGVCGLRQYLKGWGNNLRGEYKREKARQLAEIEEIDKKLNSGVGGGGRWRRKLITEENDSRVRHRETHGN